MKHCKCSSIVPRHSATIVGLSNALLHKCYLTTVYISDKEETATHHTKTRSLSHTVKMCWLRNIHST